MGKSKINWRAIQQKVSRSKKLNKSIEVAGRRRVELAKRKLMEGFENHPITQEISGGSNSSNISGSLGGYGNLFSFLGFPNGANPISDVRRLLNASIRVKVGRPSSSRNLTSQNFTIKVPNIKDFAAVGKMPYEGGNSWIEMIERGISNFSSYMNKKSSASRSGSGIQIKGKIRMGSSIATPYMTKLLNNFRKELMRK